MPFPNFQGRKRLWTRENVIEALSAAAREIQGPLPCFDRDYNAFKKDRLDWPTSHRILEYFHSMGRAWLAAGVDPARVSLRNVNWLPEEDEYLLEHAGAKTLDDIAKHLRRSYSAIRARLNKNHNTASRHNQGYLSAADLAKEYNCSYHRIRTALREGKIKGRFDKKRNRWQIDMAKVMSSTAAQMILHRPKRTHKSSPTDVGNYCRRHGLRRTLREGKMIYILKEGNSNDHRNCKSKNN
ncbi:MAG: hypothetical protein PHU23_04965 [Dehalococcoidales bacterium]|nr:hypothetical protein [Dehalococcoidales bacterium]